MIPKQKVLALCPDKLAIYKLLKRNKYYLPSLKSSMMTIKFMRGVIFETAYWLPRNEDMTFHSCAEEPSCKEIAAELKLALIKACNEGDWKNESERRRCRNTA